MRADDKAAMSEAAMQIGVDLTHWEVPNRVAVLLAVLVNECLHLADGEPDKAMAILRHQIEQTEIEMMRQLHHWLKLDGSRFVDAVVTKRRD